MSGARVLSMSAKSDRSQSRRIGDLVSSRADGWAIAILVGSVAVIFAIPALLDHPAISADNLIQNFPLRVLSGQQLASGHLPLWNPLSFSGTPLLGSMNAGSLFPLTIPFAFLPAVLIWTINMMACYWASGIGMFLVGKYFGLSVRGALLAGLIFTFMGAQWGQMVHLGVIQGQGLLPWALLAMIMLADRIRGADGGDGSRLNLELVWPVIGLVAVTALVVLTGEPRAIADLEMMGVLAGIYGALVSPGPRGWRSLGTLFAYGVCAVWGACIGAIQLLPGYSFIGISQRSDENYGFFASGSLALHHLALMGIPLFYGTNGVFNQDRYFADYNLPEVTGYIGLVGLVAVVAAALWILSAKSRSGSRHLWFFVGMAIAGLLLATAGVTPLGHLFYAIPLWGKTRLQSRSIIFFDLAGAFLAGWFVDRFIEGSWSEISFVKWRRWIVLSPLFLVACVLLMLIVVPNHVMVRFDIPSSRAFNGSQLRSIFLLNLLLVLGAIAVLLLGPKLTRRTRATGITALILSDMVIFIAFATTGLVSGDAQVTPNYAYASSYLGSQGRFAIVDNPGSNLHEAGSLGMPNLNVFTTLPSVQGYGSLIDANYSSVTQDHTQQTLGACQFGYGNFRNLRLSSMYIGNEMLIQRYLPQQRKLLSASPYCPGLPNPTKLGSRVFYFGTQLRISTVMVMINLSSLAQPSDVRLLTRNSFDKQGYLGPWVSPTQTTKQIDGGVSISLRVPQSAVEMKIVATGNADTGVVDIGDATQVVSTNPARWWLMSGAMQDVMDMSKWRLTRMAPSGSIFKAPSVQPLAWMSSGTVVKASMSAYGTEQATVVAKHNAILSFSESSLPGWTANLTPLSGGPSITETVGRSDAIQTVAIPTGAWKVSLRYRAPHLSLGIAASTFGVLALLSVFTGAVVLGRRRTAGED